jgi:hypothetical protein
MSSDRTAHWRRCLGEATGGRERRRHRLHLWINLVGALTTGSALLVIIVAKFAEGAWIVIMVIPLVIALLKAIRRYYDELAARLRGPAALTLTDTTPPIVLVATEDWNQLSEKALEFALTLSPDTIAVHLTRLSGPEADAEDRDLKTRWREHVEKPAVAAGLVPPRLFVVQAQYRTIHEPILKLAVDLERQFGRRRIAVLIPEVVKQRWYQYVLHTNHAGHLRSKLLQHGGAQLTVISVPWRLDGMGRTEADHPVEDDAAPSGGEVRDARVNAGAVRLPRLPSERRAGSVHDR